jgi:plasmid stabilization system protein ParE
VAREVRYLVEALEEAEAAAAWYAARSPSAASSFDAELAAAEQAISQYPLAWPPFESDTHRYLLRRFPFSVVYYLEAHRAVIVAVAHAHRRPGYWRSRLQRPG